MQETHVDSLKLGRRIANQIEGKVFWPSGQPRGRGVAIFINKTANVSAQHFVCDPVGRFILLDVQINDRPVRFFNVYAPNVPAERKQFFKDVYSYLVTP